MNTPSDLNNIKSELSKTKEELEKLKGEKTILQDAIWHMLNYSTIFVLILDKNMSIKLINYSLATRLGFKDETQPIGKCWLDFIKSEEVELNKTIHHQLNTNPDKLKVYRETVNEIITLNKEPMIVKWFNIPINSSYYIVLSFGIERKKPLVEADDAEDSLRAYYSDIIEKDRSMINALRDRAITDINIPPMCIIEG